MTGFPTAARGFPWVTHRTVAEIERHPFARRNLDAKVCQTCGIRLDSRNQTGFCKAHHRAAHLPSETEFAAFAEGKTAYFVSRRYGMHQTTVRDWAIRLGVKLAPSICGRPATRKPMPVINDMQSVAAVSVAAACSVGKSWCEQCQRRVSAVQAAACRSPFCKATVAA